jgi:hypothetical protein
MAHPLRAVQAMLLPLPSSPAAGLLADGAGARIEGFALLVSLFAYFQICYPFRLVVFRCLRLWCFDY